MRIFFFFPLQEKIAKKKNVFSARTAEEKQVDEQNTVLFSLLAPGFCFLPPEHLQLY